MLTKRDRLALAFCLLSSLTAGAQDHQPAKRTGTIAPLPRDLEIQLALSSLPAHLRDQATVYVLNPQKGFDVARTGTNGFSALVARTGDDAMRGSWPLTAYPDDVLYPIAWDQAGIKAQLRVFLDIAEMQAKGMPPQDVKRIIQQRYKTNVYKAPERAGVSYMLSPILRTYTNPELDGSVATSNIPHVMHYAPNVSNEDVGAAFPAPEALQYYSQHGRWPASPSPFVVLHGPHGYHVQFLGVTETAAHQRVRRDACEVVQDQRSLVFAEVEGPPIMNSQGFTTTFSVDQNPEAVFDAVINVRGWWSGEIVGPTDELGATFTYRYGDMHRSTQQIIDFIRGKRVVWRVVDSSLAFVKDQSEWNETEIVFEISETHGKTKLGFTHRGLVPQYECYNSCSNAWGMLINGNLRRLIATGERQPDVFA